jgi:hypothetical protein
VNFRPRTRGLGQRSPSSRSLRCAARYAR